MLSIRPQVKQATKKPQTQQRRDLTRMPGFSVDDGRAIEWGGAGGYSALTDLEIEMIRRETGCQKVNTVRAEAIKSLMTNKTCADIVRHFRSRKGYSERTIKGIHAALSKAGVGGDK